MGMMSSINACFIILVPIIFSIGALVRSFDFYYFVQQWPVSYCNSNRKHSGECCYLKTEKRPPNFSIHGLWPTYKDGKWPQYCYPSREFNFSKISDLKTDLDWYWGALNCSGMIGQIFWENQWKKHGTSSVNLDQRSYFVKTLSLRKKIDLLGALQVKGIDPDGKVYNLSDIQEAIRHGTGKRPRVKCDKGRQQLYEVYVCVDITDASTVIDCPTKAVSNCGKTVVFPAFGDDDLETLEAPESEMVVFHAFGDDDLEAPDEL